MAGYTPEHVWSPRHPASVAENDDWLNCADIANSDVKWINDLESVQYRNKPAGILFIQFYKSKNPQKIGIKVI